MIIRLEDYILCPTLSSSSRYSMRSCVLQVASYKKKSDSLAKELKVAIAGGGGATAGADKAKVHELEKKLEVSPFSYLEGRMGLSCFPKKLICRLYRMHRRRTRRTNRRWREPCRALVGLERVSLSVTHKLQHGYNLERYGGLALCLYIFVTTTAGLLRARREIECKRNT